MADPSKSTVIVDNFNGMATVLDEGELKTGYSAFQMNVVCVRPGVLEVRNGLREIAVDDD